MKLSSEITVHCVWADEGDEAELAGHRKELRDLGDAANVFSTILSCEAKVLVKATSDDITIKNEAFVGVPEHLVYLGLHCLRETRLACSGEPSEPECGSFFDAVGWLLADTTGVLR